MAGLLSGAMAGLGRGFSDTGQFLMRVTADEQKERRLRAYEESVRQSTWEREENRLGRQWEREDGHRAEDRELRASERAEDRSWQVEDRDFNASEARALASMRAASGGGGTGRLDPIFKAQLDELGNRRKLIQERLDSGMLDDATSGRLRLELAEINDTISGMLGMGSSAGGGLAGDLASMLGLDDEPAAGTPEGGGEPPPPRRFADIEQQASGAQDQRRQAREQASEQRRIEREINAAQALVNRASPTSHGGLLGAAVTPGAQASQAEAAEQARRELQALYDSGRLDADQRRRVERLVHELARHAR